MELSILYQSDFNKPLVLHTDWNVLDLGAILVQKEEEQYKHVMAYASHKNNCVQSNYSSYKGEYLAVVWAITHLQSYLYSTKFTFYTDHQLFKWLMINDKLTEKLDRWTLIFPDYEFEVIYRSEVIHENADTISRNSTISFIDIIDVQEYFDVPFFEYEIEGS